MKMFFCVVMVVFSCAQAFGEMGLAKPFFLKVGHTVVRRVASPDWLPIPPCKSAPENLSSLPHFCVKMRMWSELQRFPYHNNEGKLLGYWVTFRDHEGKKFWRPLSYGFYGASNKNEKILEPHWRFRNFVRVGQNCPLYDVHRIVENPNLPVLITCGEFACEAAKKEFPNCIPTTWSCGKNSLGMADWGPVLGRNGFYAANPCVDIKSRDTVQKLLATNSSKLPENHEVLVGFLKSIVNNDEGY